MIIGAHAIIYSRKPEADRAFLRDIFGLPHVDAGGGWLIFGLPPSEVAVHPARRSGVHELYFLCADVRAFVRSMKKQGFACRPIESRSYGRLTQLRLPGGGTIGVYEPRHPRPKAHRARRTSRNAP